MMTRIMSVLSMTLFAVLSAPGDARAAQEPHTETEPEGPERPLTDTSDSLESKSVTLDSPDIKSDPEYMAYNRLRTAGLVLAAGGGLVVIAGAIWMATMTLDGLIIGAMMVGTAGLLVMIPGIIMAAASHHHRNQVLERNSSRRRRHTYRPSLQGVSLITSTRGKGIEGLAVNFTF